MEAGKGLGMPDGVLINGKGPYRYNETLVPAGLAYEKITVDPGIYFRGLVSLPLVVLHLRLAMTIVLGSRPALERITIWFGAWMLCD